MFCVKATFVPVGCYECFCLSTDVDFCFSFARRLRKSRNSHWLIEVVELNISSAHLVEK